MILTEDLSRYMPPTLPVLGKPCIAVVFAQLIVDGARCGVRPFLVQLNDGKHMCAGITARSVNFSSIIDAALKLTRTLTENSHPATARAPSFTPSPPSHTSASLHTPSSARPPQAPIRTPTSCAPSGASAPAHSRSAASQSPPSNSPRPSHTLTASVGASPPRRARCSRFWGLRRKSARSCAVLRVRMC